VPDNRTIAWSGIKGDGRAGAPSALVTHLASGEAALMLLECLLYRLVERRLLSAAEIVDAIEAAVAAKRQMIADGAHAEVASVAIGTLSVLANSVAAVAIERTQADDSG
jgi:hypothetical protein